MAGVTILSSMLTVTSSHLKTFLKLFEALVTGITTAWAMQYRMDGDNRYSICRHDALVLDRAIYGVLPTPYIHCMSVLMAAIKDAEFLTYDISLLNRYRYRDA